MLFQRENDFDEAINNAVKINLPENPRFVKNLTKAIIAQESSFDPKAFRVEPKINDASRGLMQILYRTAKGVGYAGNSQDLFDPKINIVYGQKYLIAQLKRYPASLEDAISAYNGGHALKLKSGGYSNQFYVDMTKKYLTYFLAVDSGDQVAIQKAQDAIKKK
jgi:soluble lytic murein transglycosylase-like protein